MMSIHGRAHKVLVRTLADDLHVTIAYSKQPVDWQQFTPQENHLTVRGGSRCVQHLGDKGAMVLSFPTKTLHRRWHEFCSGGASWEHDGYHPHVTISFNADVDLATIEPYAGDLVFGPEQFDVPDEDWSAQVDESPLRA